MSNQFFQINLFIMSVLRIGILQMHSSETDQEFNLQKGIEYCRKAKQNGCHIALFPEMWNVGYYEISRDEVVDYSEVFRKRSIRDDSHFVKAYQKLALELDMVIALTYLGAPSHKDDPEGVMIVIDRMGQIVYKYAKVHTCDFDMGAIYKPGEGFPVGRVETQVGPVNVGSMLCFDREFPESARILMLNGAEVLLCGNCCVLDDKRINQFQARAFENATAVVMANYPSPQTNGRSVAFDGEGNLIVQAGKREGLYIADIDLEALRSYRSTCGWGNAFRRPHRYEKILSYEVAEPFERETPFGSPFERTNR